MGELKTLYRHSSQYFTGQLAGIALGFISFPIFVRVFSVADYGLLSLVLKIAAMATVLSKMGLQNSVQRFYEEYANSPEQGALKRFYSTLLFGGALTAGTVMVVFVIGVAVFPAVALSSTLKNGLLFGSALIFIRGTQSLVMGFLRAERRTAAFNVLDVVTKAATIAVTCLLLFGWSRSVKSALLGSIIVEAASVLMVVAVLVRRRFISLTTFDRKLLWASLVFGFPLVGYELAGVILDSGGRIVVQQYLGFEAVGYYSAGYNIATYVSQLLMVPVNLALFPIYMRLWVTKGREETQSFLSSALDNFLMAGMCVMAGVIVSAHDAVIFLGSRKLMAAYPLLPVLVGGLMLYSLHIFFNAGLLIYKRTFTMAKLIASAATLNIVLNIVLIPIIGLMGAAVATLLGYAAFIGLMIRASSKVLPLRFDLRASLRYSLAAGISVLLTSRFHCPILLANLLIRGTLCLLVYGAVLYGIDNHFRSMITGAVRYATARRQKSGPELTRTAA